MSSPTQLLREKNSLVNEARSILDVADRKRRDCTVDETRRYDRLMDRAGVIRKEVRVSLPLPKGTREIRAFVPNQPLFELPAVAEQRILGGDGASATVGPRGTSECRTAFRKYLTRGVQGLSRSELRALQGDDDTAGGYLIAPEEFVAELLKEQGDTQWIRQLARVFTGVKAAGIGAPKRTAKMNTFAFSSELEQATADTSLKFGFRKLWPHHLTGEIRVSRDLLAQSEIAEEVVRSEMAEDKGSVEEQRFMTGHGSGEPLGVFTASADGISTARDVSEDNTTTAPTLDGLKSAKYSLKDQHLRNANWILHRDVIKVVAKIKDGEGNYIWAESVRVDEPDRLLGKPVLSSEFAPSTLTTGLYVGILGDFRRYWIADGQLAEIQRIEELYAATNQVGFIGRFKVDGMPVLEEAFARVKLA